GASAALRFDRAERPVRFDAASAGAELRRAAHGHADVRFDVAAEPEPAAPLAADLDDDVIAALADLGFGNHVAGEAVAGRGREIDRRLACLDRIERDAPLEDLHPQPNRLRRLKGLGALL